MIDHVLGMKTKERCNGRNWIGNGQNKSAFFFSDSNIPLFWGEKDGLQGVLGKQRSLCGRVSIGELIVGM